MEQIKQFIRKNMDQIRYIKKEDVIYSPELRWYCEKNHCGMYRQTWVCPPGVGSVAALKQQYISFPSAIFFAKTFHLEDQFDIDSMNEARKTMNTLAKQINQLIIENKLKAKVLGFGGCDICNKCTYPLEPCRYPDRALPSLEAIGINVSETALACKMTYYKGPKTVTYFGMVFYE